MNLPLILSPTAPLKTRIKPKLSFLVKDLKNRYEIKPLIECGDKLNQYQIIKYCIPGIC